MIFKNYRTKTFVILTLISIFVLIVIIGFNYYINRHNLIKSYEEIRQNTVNQTVMALNLIDVSYKIMNKSMNQYMKKISKDLHKQYKDVDGDISQLDLKSLKNKYRISDIYFINRQGVIERTTFRKDLNLDLYNFGDSFKEFLINVRKEGKYVSPPMAIENKTKLLKNYSYYPTYDKEYIIELGWYDNDFDKSIFKADFNSLVQNIKKQHEIVKEIRILTDDYIVLYDDKYHLSNEHIKILDDKLEQDKVISIADNSHNQIYKYKLVKMDSMTEGRIAQIVFTNKPMLREMKRMTRLNLFLMLCGSIITLIVTYFFSQKIINPAKLKKIKKKILLINERKKIASEIHDMLGHILTTAIMQLQLGKKLIKNEEIELALDKFTLVENRIREGLQDIRSTVRFLKESREELDFVSLIESLIKDTKKYADVLIKYKIEDITELSILQKEIIYRALKEGLTNGLKHGQASYFVFDLQTKENKVKFLLQDNGCGCEELTKDFGLTTMEDRVKGQGGSLEISSQKNEGFTLQIEMPLKGGSCEDD